MRLISTLKPALAPRWDALRPDAYPGADCCLRRVCVALLHTRTLTRTQCSLIYCHSPPDQEKENVTLWYFCRRSDRVQKRINGEYFFLSCLTVCLSVSVSHLPAVRFRRSLNFYQIQHNSYPRDTADHIRYGRVKRLDALEWTDGFGDLKNRLICKVKVNGFIGINVEKCIYIDVYMWIYSTVQKSYANKVVNICLHF